MKGNKCYSHIQDMLAESGGNTATSQVSMLGWLLAIFIVNQNENLFCSYCIVTVLDHLVAVNTEDSGINLTVRYCINKTKLSFRKIGIRFTDREQELRQKYRKTSIMEK